MIFATTPFGAFALIDWWGARGVAFIFLGAYCLILGGYLLWIMSYDIAYATRSKIAVLIGRMLIIASLPLLLKGILFFCSAQQ